MQQALKGVKVLDLGHIYQGPYCGLILSYFGADVVKVEPPGGETLRGRSPENEPVEAQMMNANKRGIAIDLKSGEGKEVFKDLVEVADVIIENFSSGKMSELGLGYETLSELNEDLVYAHGSGYGDDGPYQNYPAMDITIQAISGVVHTTGFPDGPPVKAGPAIIDFIGGIHLASGVLGALFKRERTGEGEYVDVAMFDCAYPMLMSPLAKWISDMDVPPRTGNQHSGLSIAPYNIYEVTDGYVAIACISEPQWQRLVRLMGEEWLLEEERFDSKVSRADHYEEIDSIVEEWLAGRIKDEVVDRLIDAGISCAPVQTLEELVEDPQLEYREMLNYLENKESRGWDEIPVPGMPIKFASTEGPEIQQSPRVGEHTDEVLSEYLAYESDRIDALRADESIK